MYSVTSGVESSSAECESAADSAGLVVEGVMTNATAGMDMRHLSPAIVAAVMQPQVGNSFIPLLNDGTRTLVARICTLCAMTAAVTWVTWKTP